MSDLENFDFDEFFSSFNFWDESAFQTSLVETGNDISAGTTSWHPDDSAMFYPADFSDIQGTDTALFLEPGLLETDLCHPSSVFEHDPSVPLFEFPAWLDDTFVDFVDPSVLERGYKNNEASIDNETAVYLAPGTPEEIRNMQIDAQGFPAANMDQAALGRTSSAGQKRKAPGPPREISLPPAKRGGRKGPMTSIEREERRRARQSGACIVCRQRKKKCDGKTPCGSCLENMKPTLSKQPCAKASFLDIIEEKPCVAYTRLFTFFTTYIENRPFRDLDLPHSVLHGQDLTPEVIRQPAEPISLASLLVYVQEVGLTLRKFPQRTKNIRDDGYKLPSLISQDKNSTYEILRCFKGLSPLFLGYNPEGDKRKAFAWKQLAFCLSFQCISQIRDKLPSQCVTCRFASDPTRWLSEHQVEICLFRYLQQSLNNLSSEPDLPELISLIFSVMIYVSIPLFWMPERAFQMTGNCETQRTIQECADRHNRLRAILFVYATIANSRLPAWSHLHGERDTFLIDRIRHECHSLTVYDMNVNTGLVTSNLLIQNWKNDFGNTGQTSLPTLRARFTA